MLRLPANDFLASLAGNYNGVGNRKTRSISASASSAFALCAMRRASWEARKELESAHSTKRKNLALFARFLPSGRRSYILNSVAVPS